MHQRIDHTSGNPARSGGSRRLPILALLLALAVTATPAAAREPEAAGASPASSATTRVGPGEAASMVRSATTANRAAPRLRGARPSPLLMLVMLLQKR